MRHRLRLMRWQSPERSLAQKRACDRTVRGLPRHGERTGRLNSCLSACMHAARQSHHDRGLGEEHNMSDMAGRIRETRRGFNRLLPGQICSAPHARKS